MSTHTQILTYEDLFMLTPNYNLALPEINYRLLIHFVFTSNLSSLTPNYIHHHLNDNEYFFNDNNNKSNYLTFFVLANCKLPEFYSIKLI
jgi:hypothetical protein